MEIKKGYFKMENKKISPEKWITIKIKSKIWWEVKARAHKDGRKLNWYVEEALKEYLDGNKKN